MTATKAIVRIAGHNVELPEQAIAEINATIADCPVSQGDYSDAKPDAGKRMQLKATLTIEPVITSAS